MDFIIKIFKNTYVHGPKRKVYFGIRKLDNNKDTVKHTLKLVFKNARTRTSTHTYRSEDSIPLRAHLVIVTGQEVAYCYGCRSQRLSCLSWIIPSQIMA